MVATVGMMRMAAMTEVAAHEDLDVLDVHEVSDPLDVSAEHDAIAAHDDHDAFAATPVTTPRRLDLLYASAANDADAADAVPEEHDAATAPTCSPSRLTRHLRRYDALAVRVGHAALAARVDSWKRWRRRGGTYSRIASAT